MHSEIISLKCMTRYFTRLCFGTDGKDLIPILQNPREWSIFCIELKEIAHMENFQDFQIGYSSSWKYNIKFFNQDVYNIS